MKFLLTEDFVKIPEGVTVSIKSRKITIEGPKGKIEKNFKHIACELKIVKLDQKIRKGKFISIQMWFGRYKQTCQVNTLRGLVRNMFTGVTDGYLYKMRTVYNHFPINMGISKDKKTVEIKNFLGGKNISKINLLPGVTIETTGLKDEYIFKGIDNQNVSLSCAQISQSCPIGRKDDRKFLDGIYVSSKGTQQ